MYAIGDVPHSYCLVATASDVHWPTVKVRESRGENPAVVGLEFGNALILMVEFLYPRQVNYPHQARRVEIVHSP